MKIILFSRKGITPRTEDIEEILGGILDYAVENGLCDDNITAKDIFDTRIMGAITPMPREIVRTFWEKYKKDPVEATDWYYKFSCDTDYIRRYRIKKDMRWKYSCEYGDLDITINLSKPEKSLKEIMAAKNAPQAGYPKCLLCKENVGFEGNATHPPRANHRIIPLMLNGHKWCLQYSPYVYYNEHCIIFDDAHTPMKISEQKFRRLCEFVKKFPHYMLGSNSDLPIAGGSILTHEHFQGGSYTFAMEKAEIEAIYNEYKITVNIKSVHKEIGCDIVQVITLPSYEKRIDIENYILTRTRPKNLTIQQNQVLNEISIRLFCNSSVNCSLCLSSWGSEDCGPYECV